MSKQVHTLKELKHYTFCLNQLNDLGVVVFLLIPYPFFPNVSRINLTVILSNIEHTIVIFWYVQINSPVFGKHQIQHSFFIQSNMMFSNDNNNLAQQKTGFPKNPLIYWTFDQWEYLPTIAKNNWLSFFDRKHILTTKSSDSFSCHSIDKFHIHGYSCCILTQENTPLKDSYICKMSPLFLYDLVFTRRGPLSSNTHPHQCINGQLRCLAHVG